MVFFIVSIVVPLLVYLGLPRLLRADSGNRHLLVIAGLLFFVSYWLPSPEVDGQQTAFMTHFVGGGIFTGFVWLYIMRAKRWRPGSWLIEAGSLYALVCSLGVANELFEVVLYMFDLMPHGIADTSWDLVANTLGVSVFYAAYLASRYTKRSK